MTLDLDDIYTTENKKRETAHNFSIEAISALQELKKKLDENKSTEIEMKLKKTNGYGVVDIPSSDTIQDEYIYDVMSYKSGVLRFTLVFDVSIGFNHFKIKDFKIDIDLIKEINSESVPDDFKEHLIKNVSDELKKRLQLMI